MKRLVIILISVLTLGSCSSDNDEGVYEEPIVLVDQEFYHGRYPGEFNNNDFESDPIRYSDIWLTREEGNVLRYRADGFPKLGTYRIDKINEVEDCDCKDRYYITLTTETKLTMRGILYEPLDDNNSATFDEALIVLFNSLKIVLGRFPD